MNQNRDRKTIERYDNVRKDSETLQWGRKKWKGSMMAVERAAKPCVWKRAAKCFNGENERMMKHVLEVADERAAKLCEGGKESSKAFQWWK